MMKLHWFLIGLAMAFPFSLAVADEPRTGQELVKDSQFRQGFILWKTKPGKHVAYGRLAGIEEKAEPVWGVSQWSSQFPLDPATAIQTGNSFTCTNSAKGIRRAETGELIMAVNTASEYGPVARKPGDPWVHLLLEQEFEPSPPLSKLKSAKFHVEAQLFRCRNLHKGDYSSDIHAAQFQIFFTVQNRNRESRGYGDMLWFGVPVYDNRHRFPPEFKARDFGGTSKFIFTSSGESFTTRSVHDGGWVVIDKDLLPQMRDALETAWARGFLKDSRVLSDYYIGGMNIGWELPGTFDVELQVRGLSLKVMASQEQQ